MCNLSESIEARGEARDEARGEARGEMRAKKQMVLRMLKNGLSCEEAADYAELSAALIRQREKEQNCAV